MSPSDRAAWIKLIDLVIGRGRIADIRAAAKRMASVQYPDTEWHKIGGRVVYDPNSPFIKLLAMAQDLEKGDVIRQVARDYAHKCRAKLGLPPVNPDYNVLVEPDADRPFRRDIDG